MYWVRGDFEIHTVLIPYIIPEYFAKRERIQQIRRTYYLYGYFYKYSTSALYTQQVPCTSSSCQSWFGPRFSFSQRTGSWMIGMRIWEVTENHIKSRNCSIGHTFLSSRSFNQCLLLLLILTSYHASSRTVATRDEYRPFLN